MQFIKFASLLTLVLGTAVYAANIPAGFDQAKFQNIQSVAAQKGAALQADPYEYRVLTHLSTSDSTQPHRADYFSAVGGLDSNGVFQVVNVSIEAEDWSKDDKGNWNIEEWSWTASNQGDLQAVDHTLVVETADGTLVYMKALPVGVATDATEIARYGAKLIEWYGYAN